jgi:hypothetical protein
MGKAVRKQVYDLTLADFDVAPVWEFASDEEGVAGQDEATVRPYEVSFPDRCCWTRRADFCNGESTLRRRLSLDAVLLKLRFLYRCFGCGQHARALKRASFWRASTEPGRPYRRLLREAKLMMRNRLAGARPISYLRVGRAIGQAGNGPVTAETEIFRGRVAHRPAAMPLLKFEQRVGLRTLAGYFW